MDALTSDIKAEVSKSVGLLHIDGQPAGTGFRVGDKYVMTCLHVIKNIIIQGLNFKLTYTHTDVLCLYGNYALRKLGSVLNTTAF